MQPLKITIYGDFWDCQIYRGRLYLWYTDGSVGVYDWDRLVETTFSNRVDELVLKCAFTRGDYLYGNELSLLFRNADFKKSLLNKFLKASKKDLSIQLKMLKNFERSKQDDPMTELPTDTCIYSNTLFAINDLGLYSGSIHNNDLKHGISTRSKKLWDCPLLSIRAANRSIAMAGGDEGVFELHLANYYGDLSMLEEVKNGIYQVSDRHSSLVNWSFASLYSSSYVDSGFLAAFGWNEHKEARRYKRIFEKLIPDSDIFNKSGFSWGSQEKIYLANCNTIEVVKYTQKNVNSDNKNEVFQHLDSISFNENLGKVISGGIAYFGVIIEYDDALQVLCSDDTLIILRESVARWRVYPRSKRYENHLHVIYEDRLVIYSFNHDYFVDQIHKVKGIQFRGDIKKPALVS
jgi:hypothetical protein